MITKKQPNAADKFAGAQLRMLRMARNMSQEKVANGVGLTFQQIQKYEKGANRMGASRLAQFAKILKVDVSAFFETTEQADNSDLHIITDFTSSRRGLALIRAFGKLAPGVQDGFVYAIEAAASGAHK